MSGTEFAHLDLYFVLLCGTVVEEMSSDTQKTAIMFCCRECCTSSSSGMGV